MVPAPMLTSRPIVASPRYVRCIDLDPGPRALFFISTKLPTFAFSPRDEPFRRCAKGPMLAPFATVTSVSTQWLRTVTRSPSRESTIRTPLWISQPTPTDVRPSSDTPGWMMVSAPTSTSRPMYVVAGSSSVTPAAINAWFLVCFTIRLTSASSARLLMPRISSGLPMVTVSTPRPWWR